MRKDILDILRCPKCRASKFSIKNIDSDQLEIRRASLICGDCSGEYSVDDGIIDFLNNPSDTVVAERKAMDLDEYITDEAGTKYRITHETIRKFKDKFLVFPQGDGSPFFRPGGSFQTIAEASDRFYSTFNSLSLHGGESVLEIGACFSFASFKFAQKGCKVAALDISNYLKVSDVYIEQAYFERVFSDMHDMPFNDNTFDIVFGAAVLHHSKDLGKAFNEVCRVLKPGGRLILINESSRGLLERVHPVYQKMQQKGFADTAYSLLEFKAGARAGGFNKVRIDLLSLADDYITRHKNRGSALTLKLRLAYFISRHRLLEQVLSFLSAPTRFLFRPKSWRLVAIK